MAELDDRLDGELRALGQTLVVAAPADDLVEQVLVRLPGEPLPTRPGDRGWGRTRRRRLVAVIIALVLLGLGLTPPVRAAVVEWLRIGGVLVRTAPPVTGPSPTPSPPPTIGPTVTLAQAKALVDFPVGVPEELGPPDRISVSTDRKVVAMDWGPGADQLHLDQFDGELSWMFLKRTRDSFQVTSVDGQDAVWFATPHQISYIDRDGRERTEQSRIAGPCLVWERGVGGRRVTMRLEGNQSLLDAVGAAESVR
jgi:hypothetical protein